MRLCSMPGCGKKSQCKGFCGMHYTRVFRYGNPNCKHKTGPKAIESCSVPGCGKKHRGLGLCSLHYFRQRDHRDLNYKSEPRTPPLDKNNMRQCKKCEAEKLLGDFGKNSKCFAGRLRVCKKCQDDRRLERLRTDPKLRKRNRLKRKKSYWKDVEKSRAINRNDKLLSKYGLTPEAWLALFEKQGGVCAICKLPELLKKRLAVDHCHITGKIRGLLCGNCNRALGQFQDSPVITQAATDYLRSQAS